MDQTAFGDFYKRTSRSLWSYVYRVTGNAADADDIVQDAFCRLLRGGPDTDEEQRRRYLFRIASNVVVDRWRRGEYAEAPRANTATSANATPNAVSAHPVRRSG